MKIILESPNFPLIEKIKIFNNKIRTALGSNFVKANFELFWLFHAKKMRSKDG